MLQYSDPDKRWRITTEGGTGPHWARRGRELFFRQGNKMMVVEISRAPAFTASKPRMLFEGEYDFAPGQLNYDVAPDSQRFIMVKEAPPTPVAKQLQIVTNWFETLRRRVPSAKSADGS
ncbi:MAG: hypothetical protein ACRD24_02730 [Terriglobales bacterium]